MAEDDQSTTLRRDEPPSARRSDERTVIDAAADLLQTIVDWLRQEAEAAVREKVVLPLQRLGFTLFFGAGGVRAHHGVACSCVHRLAAAAGRVADLARCAVSDRWRADRRLGRGPVLQTED